MERRSLNMLKAHLALTSTQMCACLLLAKLPLHVTQRCLVMSGPIALLQILSLLWIRCTVVGWHSTCACLCKSSVKLILVFSYGFRSSEYPPLLQYHKAQADAETGIKGSDAEELIRISSMSNHSDHILHWCLIIHLFLGDLDCNCCFH